MNTMWLWVYHSYVLWNFIITYLIIIIIITNFSLDRYFENPIMLLGKTIKDRNVPLKYITQTHCWILSYFSNFLLILLNLYSVQATRELNEKEHMNISNKKFNFPSLALLYLPLLCVWISIILWIWRQALGKCHKIPAKYIFDHFKVESKYRGWKCCLFKNTLKLIGSREPK